MIRIAGALLLLVSLLWGEGAQLETMIEAVQNAPASERYKAMNRFKEAVRKMNKSQRAEAISKLQRSLQGQNAPASAGTPRQPQHEMGNPQMRRQMQQNRQMLNRRQVAPPKSPANGKAPKAGGPRVQGPRH